MNELSLFTGAGGGILGSKLLGWKTVGYVEINNYCQRVIAQRIKDGVFDEAPIFGDIRTFISEGYAECYSEMVDVISGGFPCQPFSQAGKRQAETDERNMWPETIECIRQVGPSAVLLENVPRLVRFDYFGTILGDLAEAGFDAEWDVVSAGEVGAEHLRERVWIVAFNSNSSSTRWKKQYVSPFSENETQRRERYDNQLPDESSTDSKSKRCDQKQVSKVRNSTSMREPYHNGNVCNATQTRQAWGLCEPRVVGMAHDVANRNDRIRTAGNGQVPAVVKAAWNRLIERFNN